MSRTTVVVSPGRAVGSAPTVRVETDGPQGRAHLGARLLPPRGPLARIALVAEGALLLAGDEIAVHLRLQAGTQLEVVEPSGTVAYDMRGGRAAWSVRVRAEAGSVLRWRGQPFVVASGADVSRTTVVELAGDAVVALREQLVLGRTGETGGRLHTTTRVTRDGAPVVAEDLLLDGGAPRVGVLATGSRATPARVAETVSLLGRRAPGIRDEVGVLRLELEAEATLLRCLSDAAHHRPLDAAWAAVCASLAPAQRDSAEDDGDDGDDESVGAAGVGEAAGVAGAPGGRVVCRDVAQQH